MNSEKEIIKSKLMNIKLMTIMFSIFGIVLGFMVAGFMLNREKQWDEYSHCYGWLYDYSSCEELQNMSLIEYMPTCNQNSYWVAGVCIAGGFIFVSIILYLCFSKQVIIVTDKRVYGKSTFNKRIDLPLDFVSSVGTSFFKGINIGTSSGRIKFKLIKNNEELHHQISLLINERQNNNIDNSNNNLSYLDELSKLKTLLDNNIITEEEFNKKKEQILNNN